MIGGMRCVLGAVVVMLLGCDGQGQQQDEQDGLGGAGQGGVMLGTGGETEPATTSGGGTAGQLAEGGARGDGGQGGPPCVSPVCNDKECGQVPDGTCGGMADCGTCPVGLECGDNGVLWQCGNSCMNLYAGICGAHGKPDGFGSKGGCSPQYLPAPACTGAPCPPNTCQTLSLSPNPADSYWCCP